MIERSAAIGKQMEAQFAADWQPSLGRAIVAASQGDTKALELRQERLGAAIIQLTSVETSYEADRAALQEQLGGAIVVATQTVSPTGSANREPIGVSPDVMIAAQDVWPEIPTVSIVVASLALMSLFWAGLLVSARLPAVYADNGLQIGSGVPAYSKPV
jgi:hypothetical protein